MSETGRQGESSPETPERALEFAHPAVLALGLDPDSLLLREEARLLLGLD